MSTTVYYFSGTGNSLFLARELQKKLPGVTLVSIAGQLASGSCQVQGTDVGFVFPCHGLTVPIPVKRFLKKAIFGPVSYLFAVVSRGGTIFRGFPVMAKILRSKGIGLDASFIVDMHSNDPKLASFHVPTKEELAARESLIRSEVTDFARRIARREPRRADIRGVTFSSFPPLNALLERLVPFMVHNVAARVKEYFYTDHKCTACGICAQVCPSGKIARRDGKPVWQATVSCFMCYACLNFCPVEAVQIRSKFYMKSFTPEKGRYPHPYAGVKDMKAQKQG